MAELYHFFTVDEVGTKRDHWRYTDAKRNIVWESNLYVAKEIKGDRWSRDLRDQENQIIIPIDLEPFPKFLPSDPARRLAARSVSSSRRQARVQRARAGA
jgi:hypothetical protein